MVEIRRRSPTKILAGFLSFLLIMPFLAGAASATLLDSQPAQSKLALLDLTNGSSQGGDRLAEQATDAIFLALAQLGRFQLIGRDKVKEATNGSHPSSQQDLLNVGDAVGADWVLSGQVSKAEVNGSPKRAEVAISVRLTNVQEPALEQKAYGVGRSQPRLKGTGEEEELLAQAVNAAAASATRQLESTFSTSGVVTSLVSDKQVLISLGQQDQLRKGAEIHIMRGGELIAKAQVVKVNPLDSKAKVQWVREGSVIQPGDKIIVAANGPEPGQAQIGAKKKSRSNTGTALAALLILGIILATSSRK